MVRYYALGAKACIFVTRNTRLESLQQLLDPDSRARIVLANPNRGTAVMCILSHSTLFIPSYFLSSYFDTETCSVVVTLISRVCVYSMMVSWGVDIKALFAQCFLYVMTNSSLLY